MDENQIKKLEEELESDCNIDITNLSMELKKQSDLIHKWSSRLAKIERKWEDILRLIERQTYEKYKFYSEDFEKTLKNTEIKIYVDGDKSIIDLKNKRDDLKFLINRLKGGLQAIRAKGRSLNQIVTMRERDNY